MNQLMLQLPDTLHKQLTHLAKGEGVSLDQFIVYALTRQVAQTYSVFKVPQEEINQQQQAFESLLQSLGEASPEETDAILAEREVVEPESELTSEVIDRLKQKIQDTQEA